MSHTEKKTNRIPHDWNSDAHQLWLGNKRIDAIQAAIASLNSDKEHSKGFGLQSAYYLFLIQDYRAAADILRHALNSNPRDPDLLLNLVVSLSRCKNYAECITQGDILLEMDTDNFVLWDVLAKAYYHRGNPQQASAAGSKSLALKDKRHGASIHKPATPEKIPAELNELQKVISFSLWGSNKRYLYGTLRNLLLAADIYPDCQLRFYLDTSVPADFISLIEDLGGHVIVKELGAATREKLSWRFEVANDPTVGHFLIRDTDSVINLRERLAVEQWLSSGKGFHIIRDWWTHTDLILAGLWGGVSGALPNHQRNAAELQSRHHGNTQH